MKVLNLSYAKQAFEISYPKLYPFGFNENEQEYIRIDLVEESALNEEIVKYLDELDKYNRTWKSFKNSYILATTFR